MVGGFHLSGPLFEPIIAPTCDALAGLRPTTSSRRTARAGARSHAIAARLPDAFLQNSVGTRLEFVA